MVAWFKNNGGKKPPGADIIQVALKFGVLPDAVEQMDIYWFNRVLIWMKAETEALKQ